MSTTNLLLRLAVACVFALVPQLIVAQPFTFDDIEYWVGTGANRAALVIDWDDQSTFPPALAWGYRWDGTAYGRDMLKTVLMADNRLFAKLGGSLENPVAVYGLGYDTDDDSQFALDDGTLFDSDGIALSGPADLALSIDPGDRYAEGWFTGFWHYGVAASNPYDGGTWSDISVGLAGRELADGAWDSWTFTPTFNFAAFAENPVAAVPPMLGPPMDLPGDFDGNNRVDAADYQVWKNTFGSMLQLAADANGNGIVDAADYTIWRNYLGAPNHAAAFALRVPEPSSAWLALGSLVVLLQLLNRKRKEGTS